MSTKLIPIAISSQLDVTGEERIHAANYTTLVRPSYVAPVFGWYLVGGTQAGTPSPALTIWKQDDTSFTNINQPSTQPTGDEGYTIDFSPDGTYLAVGAFSFTPYLTLYKRTGDSFDVISAPTISQKVKQVAFSPDGEHLAVTQAVSVLIYKRTGDTFSLIDTIAGVAADCLAYSPNGNMLIICTNSSNFVRIYTIAGDIYTAGAVYAIGGIPWACDFTSDGTKFAVSIQNTTNTYTIYDVGVDTLSVSLSINSATSGRALRYSPDGSYMAAGRANGLDIYRTSDYTVISSPMTFAALDVSWSSDSSYVAAAGPENTGVRCIKVFNQIGGTFTEVLPPDPPVTEGLAVAYSPLVQL